jgi:hypothetical protein
MLQLRKLKTHDLVTLKFQNNTFLQMKRLLDINLLNLHVPSIELRHFNSQDTIL